MCNRRDRSLVILLLAVGILLSACSPPAPTAAPSPTAQPALPTGADAEWDVVVIGDSSLWGLGDALASQIEQDVGVKVALHDATVGGLSATQVLQALQTGDAGGSLVLKQLPDKLREAEVVVMWTNPDDSVMPDNPMNVQACLNGSDPGQCPPDSFEAYTEDLEAVWAEIIELRAGQPTVLRATDLYNPLVVPWHERDVFEACTECWKRLSRATKLAAEAYNIPFLSRYDAFNGADHEQDPRETGYIGHDGVHPSKLGAEYTADLLSEMGYKPVTPP